MDKINSNTNTAFQSSVGQRAMFHKGKPTWSKFVESVVAIASEKCYNITGRNKKSLGLGVNLPEFKLEVQTRKSMIDNSKRAFDAKVAKKYSDKFHNATRRGVEFDLSFTDMKNLMKQTHCYYTGVELVDDRNSDLRMSLERVDENLGYTKENTRAVTLAANAWKGLVLDHGGTLEYNLGIEEIKLILEKLS